MTPIWHCALAELRRVKSYFLKNGRANNIDVRSSRVDGYLKNEQMTFSDYRTQTEDLTPSFSVVGTMSKIISKVGAHSTSIPSRMITAD